jgi:hypothetical protein
MVIHHALLSPVRLVFRLPGRHFFLPSHGGGTQYRLLFDR